MRLVKITGKDQYNNNVEETVDLDETFEEMIEKAAGRKIPVGIIIVKKEDKTA